jgi:hypothetical protein
LTSKIALVDVILTKNYKVWSEFQVYQKLKLQTYAIKVVNDSAHRTNYTIHNVINTRIHNVNILFNSIKLNSCNSCNFLNRESSSFKILSMTNFVLINRKNGDL